MSKFFHKFDDTEDCRLFVTSDLHLNHRQPFIWEARGYSSIDAHTSGVIEVINDTCRPQDILLNLGDLCLNTKSEDLESLLGRIHCKHWLLKGNHNNPWEKEYGKACQNDFFNGHSMKCEIYGIDAEWFPNVFVLGNYHEFMWNGQMVVANHYPFLVWNQMQHGSWSIVGHSHGSCKLSRPDNFQMKQLDCGWDLHKRPLSFDEIRKIMNKKQIAQNDKHDKDTN